MLLALPPPSTLNPNSDPDPTGYYDNCKRGRGMEETNHCEHLWQKCDCGEPVGKQALHFSVTVTVTVTLTVTLDPKPKPNAYPESDNSQRTCFSKVDT